MTTTKPTQKRCPKHKAYDASYCPVCKPEILVSNRKPATAAAAKKTPAKKTVTTAKVDKPARPLPDGFTLGMKVTSSKDGLTYEVAGPDRSSAYVVLRNA